MKKIALTALIALSPLVSHTALANDSQKIAVVKKVFNDLENRDSIITKNATFELKNAIAYGEQTINGEFSCVPWEIVGGGQDPDVINAKKANYQPLKNGNIKVTVKQYGELETIIYVIKNVNGKYLIDDILNGEDSLKTIAKARTECYS